MDFTIGSGGVFKWEDGGHLHRFWAGGIQVQDLAYGMGNTLPIVGGQLFMSSGTFLRASGNNLFWSSGGKLSLQGCADLNHDHKCDRGDFKGTLMTGKFVESELIHENGHDIFEGEIVDTLSPQLAALLGLPDVTYTEKIQLMLVQLRNGRWWVRDQVQGGSISDIPESSSVWLLGGSIFCLAAIRWAPALLAIVSAAQAKSV